MKVMSGATTIVVGLNAALQKRFILPPSDSLQPGNVHRAHRVQVGLGGKGQDVAVTLSCLQYQGRVQLAQFAGKGAEGDLVYQILEDLLGEEAMELTVRPNSIMRTCTSIVARDSTTELVEPSPVIHEHEIQALFDRLQGKTADALIFMGSMPPGCADDTYATIYNTVANKNTLCLIDSVVGLTELLQAVASKSADRGPVILKCNASELCRLAKVPKATSEAGGVNVEELVRAITAFIQMYDYQALSAIAVTDGAHDAYFAAMPVESDDEFRLFKLPVARLQNNNDQQSSNNNSNNSKWGQWVETLKPDSSAGKESGPQLYPIGAGDAVAAGTLAAWKLLSDNNHISPCLPSSVQTLLAGNERPFTRAMMTAFSFGLACGAASCLEEENSVLQLQTVLDLFGKEGRPIFVSSHKVTNTNVAL
jgi:fructose-1-phosphate kinase PfkB-like protein